MKKFLLADDHVVVRSGLKTVLSEAFDSTEIHEAHDGESTKEMLGNHFYDLVVLDIQMPQTNAQELLKFIHDHYPLTKVLIYSMSAENIYAKRFLKEGASGYVSKEAPLDEIKKAITMILNGRKYISDAMLDKLANDTLSGRHANPFDRLSPKEFEIASLLLSGKTLSEISESLNIHTSTAGTHKARLFEKLEVSNLLELSELAKAYNL
jgi:two-component system invasion response regulator UvrY